MILRRNSAAANAVAVTQVTISRTGSDARKGLQIRVWHLNDVLSLLKLCIVEALGFIFLSTLLEESLLPRFFGDQIQILLKEVQ